MGGARFLLFIASLVTDEGTTTLNIMAFSITTLGIPPFSITIKNATLSKHIYI
jgi:hypothetical protein